MLALRRASGRRPCAGTVLRYDRLLTRFGASGKSAASFSQIIVCSILRSTLPNDPFSPIAADPATDVEHSHARRETRAAQQVGR